MRRRRSSRSTRIIIIIMGMRTVLRSHRTSGSNLPGTEILRAEAVPSEWIEEASADAAGVTAHTVSTSAGGVGNGSVSGSYTAGGRSIVMHGYNIPTQHSSHRGDGSDRRDDIGRGKQQCELKCGLLDVDVLDRTEPEIDIDRRWIQMTSSCGITGSLTERTCPRRRASREMGLILRICQVTQRGRGVPRSLSTL